MPKTNQNNQLSLYFDFLSQPSRALYIILKVSGKAFEACAINLLEGEHLTDTYKEKINRFQKVPAIIDGDYKLAESVAILRYLSHKQYIATSFYPADLEARARVDEFLQWQHNGIRSSCSLYFRFTWVQMRIFGAPASEGKVAKYKGEMERDLKMLESIWLGDARFLTGNQLTAADVFGVCEVQQIRTTGYDVREKYTKIANWIEAVRAELNPYFDIAHQKIYEFERETKAKLV